MSDQKQHIPNEAESRSIRTRYYTLSYYQHQAARTLISEPDFELTVEEQMILWNIDGLAGEVGEMMNTIKKAIWHRKGVELLKGDDFKAEIGDALWYMAALCTKLGFEMGEVAAFNIEKLEERFPDGYDQERTPDIKFQTYLGEEYYSGDLQNIIDEEEDLQIRVERDHYEDQKGRRFNLDQMDKILTGKELKAGNDLPDLKKYQDLINQGKYVEAAGLILNTIPNEKRPDLYRGIVFPEGDEKVDPEGMLGENFKDPGLDMRREETKQQDKDPLDDPDHPYHDVRRQGE